MRILNVRNVHDALPKAIALLEAEGVKRDSRNGPVLQMPCPVTTVYEKPWERVIFHPERDANPFFHLYESMWMLAGRNDIAPLLRYVKQMAAYSDDGVTQHASYGHRWRKHFTRLKPVESGGALIATDQLADIAKRLKKDPTDRRCVLQMWDCLVDLDHNGKDVPCNTTATFQINPDGQLDLSIFCRSNDIIWGAYGANAVHFSFLLEYMAHWIGVPMGKMYQISVNWHAYTEVMEKMNLKNLNRENPYYATWGEEVQWHPMGEDMTHEEVDKHIRGILYNADNEFDSQRTLFNPFPGNQFFRTCHLLLLVHAHYKAKTEESFLTDPRIDWERAAVEWLDRRGRDKK